MTMDELKELIEQLRFRVSMTARVFDRIGPEWYKHVNTVILDMGSCFDCIIGQAGSYLFKFEDSYSAWDVFRARYAPYEKGNKRLIRMGLMETDLAKDAILEQHWRREIESRRLLDSLEERFELSV